MKHTTTLERTIHQLLQRAATVAIVGATADPSQPGHAAASYLRREGYDVIPIHPDRAEVAGLPAYARLSDFGGAVDLVVIYAAPDEVPRHIEAAAAKGAEAVWLPPGAWSKTAEALAKERGLTVIKDRSIIEAHRHVFQRGGHPSQWG